MRLLAIDTALAACSAAVFDTETGIIASESLPMARGHAEALMPMIARVMDAATTEFAALDRIVVTVGPGSFTGLRVGVSAARGLALAARKPAIGVTTLTAYAAPLLAANDSIPVLVAIDARNDQAYMQAFDAGGHTLMPAQLAPGATALGTLPMGPARIIGSAAKRIASLLLSQDGIEIDDRAAPDIAWVARVGIAGDADVAPKPLYLRAADARPQQIGHLLRR